MIISKKLPYLDENYREPSTGDDCYKLWHSRIKNAFQWQHSKRNGEHSWKQHFNLYIGNHWGEFLENDPYYNAHCPSDKITINLTLSIVEDLLAFLVNQYPKFSANPETMDDILAAEIQPQLLNQLWKIKEFNEIIKKCLRDALIIGHGVCAVEHKFSIDDNPKNRKKDGNLTYSDVIVDNEPYLRRVKPKNFVFDPNAEDSTLNTARWCCEKIYIPVADVLANSSFNKEAIKEIKSAKNSDSFSSSYDYDIYKQGMYDNWDIELDNTHLKCYKIYDKKFEKYYLFAHDIVTPLVEKPWPYPYLLEEKEGFPYCITKYIDTNDDPHGLGIPYLIKDLQLEIDRNVTYMFVHKRNLSARKYLVKQGTFQNKDDFNKFINGGDGVICELDSPNDVQLLPNATISPDIFTTMNISEQYIRQLTGVDELIRGGNLQSRTTASEVSTRGNIFGVKIDSKVSSVKLFVCDLGYKLLSHLRNNIITQQVIKLVGQKGQFWQPFGRSDLSSRITLELEQISAERIDPVMKKQQALQTFQMITNLIPLLQQAQIPVDIGQLVSWFFEQMGQKDAVRFLPSTAVMQPPLILQGQQQQKNNVPNPQALSQPTTPAQPNAQQDLLSGLMGGSMNNLNMG